jgi:UPF0755 protein
MRRTLLLALTLAGLLCAAAGAAYLLTSPPLPPPGAMLMVREGDSLAAVAARLERAGVIRNALVFRLRARVADLDRRLQPGEYHFTAPLGAAELLDLLATGGVHPEVTIPEGLTVRDVAALLAREGYGSAESLLCVAADPEFLLAAGVPGPQLEGFLFPDTYRLTPVMSPSEILGVMVRRFHERFDAERYRRAAARGMSVNEVLTLASIVEKESALATERPVIAGVFYNRLRLGMPLQSDPTVIYAIPSFNGDLTRADLVRPSAYNTYLVTGFPPGPIANPGLAAIDAVLAPADTPYLYFVSKNDGSHVFAATLPEHNRNVARYQKSRR